MARIPHTEAELTEQAREFAASIEAQRERWEYCFRFSHYRYQSKGGPVILNPNARSMPTAAKILGRRKFWAERGFHDMRILGYDAAVERDEARRGEGSTVIPPRFEVGPFKAWEVGHVYFARVSSHPHVLKIGFSRRVHERLDDIEASHKTSLLVLPGQLKVGTLLNEQWWHRDWQQHSIAGEWFFDPRMTDRSLPAFLQERAVA